MTIPGEAEGRPFTVETLPANLLEVDPSVQRKLNDSRVTKIAADFHEAALGVMIVSARRAATDVLIPSSSADTRYVVLDGQTRLAALRKFTGTEATAFPVVCQVFTGLTRAEEAEIFLTHNDRAAVRKIDLFRLALVAEQPWAVELDAVVRRHGYEARDHVVPERRFTAISTAQRIIRLPEGLDTLDRAFDLIARSWGYRVNAASAEAVDGFGLLFHRHGKDVDVPGFALKIAATDTPQTFKANVMAYRATVGVSRTEAAYRYVLRVYNSGRRSSRRKLEAKS
jgi:uncharacterized protein DUF6551